MYAIFDRTRTALAPFIQWHTYIGWTRRNSTLGPCWCHVPPQKHFQFCILDVYWMHKSSLYKTRARFVARKAVDNLDSNCN